MISTLVGRCQECLGRLAFLEMKRRGTTCGPDRHRASLSSVRLAFRRGTRAGRTEHIESAGHPYSEWRGTPIAHSRSPLHLGRYLRVRVCFRNFCQSAHSKVCCRKKMTFHISVYILWTDLAEYELLSFLGILVNVFNQGALQHP